MNSIVNDQGCSWINQLLTRKNIKFILKNERRDWLIVGAGYMGLTVATARSSKNRYLV
jgi:ribulose 1,5-bisphosphate synthetase/thiazole synthase